MAKKKEKIVSTEVEMTELKENEIITESPDVENKINIETFEGEVSKVIDEVTKNTNEKISNLKMNEQEILKKIEENPEKTQEIVEKEIKRVENIIKEVNKEIETLNKEIKNNKVFTTTTKWNGWGYGEY